MSLNSSGACFLLVKSRSEMIFELVKFDNSGKVEGNLYDRIKAAADWVDQWLRYRHFEPGCVIGIEAPVPTGQMSAMLYTIYTLVLERIEAISGTCFVVCPTSPSWKHIWGFNRRSKKSEVVKKVKKVLDYEGRLKADCADAFCVAWTAWRFHQFFWKKIALTDLTVQERKVFASEELNSKGQKKGIIHRPGEMFFDWSAGCP